MRTRADGASERPTKGRPKRRRSSASVDDAAAAATETANNQNSTSEVQASARLTSTSGSKPRGRKRAKRVSIDDTQQLSQDLANVTHRTDAETNDNEDEGNSDGDDGNINIAEQHPSKRVRFSDSTEPVIEVPPASDPGTIAVNTPTGLTPGLRRTSLSPDREFRPTKSRNAGRRSLPASFSPSPIETVQQLQFSPLRAVLDERMRRRLRRSHLSEEVNEIEEHKREDARTRHELDKLRHEVDERDERVKQLMLELELQRQLGIEVIGEKDEEDERVREMEEELARLKREIADAREHGVFPTGDTRDDEMDEAGDDGLVLVDPADIDIMDGDTTPQLSVTTKGHTYTELGRMSSQLLSPTEASTQVSLPDPIEETERQEFEKAIATLTREASDAKATLQILSIELQNLGFSQPNVTTEVVLSAIRAAFYHARTELEELLPGEMPGNVENGALLNLLLGHIRGLLNDVHAQRDALESHEKMENLLRTQLDGVLDKLADVDSRKQQLESQWRELDVEGERKEKDIIELNSQLDILESESQERANVINEKDKTIHDLEEELSDQAKGIERLQSALQGYRDEVAGLEALVTKMDEQHKAALAEIEKNHADKVANLEEKIKIEASHRETAEAEIDEKTTRITALELQLEATSTSVDELRAQLAELQAVADSEHQARESAEASLAKQADTIAELESNISVAEASVESLSAELHALRTLAASERGQREAAEALLDERAAELAGLQDKLHEAGIAANELRGKLFEVQETREREIAQLQTEAAERESQFQEDIAAEIERREDAERDASETKEELNEAKEMAREVEEALREEISELENSVRGYEAELGDKEVEIEKLQSQVSEESENHHRIVASLERELNERDSLLGSKETDIAELNQNLERTVAELATARESLSRLEEVRTSLERRIEAEAEELLASDERHAAVESGLRSDIANFQAQIAQLRSTLQDHDRSYQDMVHEKDAEIHSLKSLVAARDDSLAAAVNEVERLRNAFRNRVLHERTELTNFIEELQGVATRVGNRAQIFGAQGAMILRALGTDPDVVDNVAAHVVDTNGGLNGTVHDENKYLRSQIRVAHDGPAEEKALEVMTAETVSEKRGGRKTTEKKKRGRRREYDSGIGVASDEQVAEDTLEVEQVM